MKIGEGSFSATFLATTAPDQSLDFSEVAKVGFKKNHIKHATELKILRQLDGKMYFPNFVYGGESGKYTFLVTEDAGEDLEKVVKRNRDPLTNKNVVRLSHIVHTAVDYLHRKGYVHRDIQASNVLLQLRNRRVRVRLCDFGDSTEINQPAKRRSSFMRLFNRQDVPSYHQSENHCHTAILCLKLLGKMPEMTRRESIFYKSHITQFELPDLVGEHMWIKLIWLNLSACFDEKTTNFSFINTFLDAAIPDFSKESDLAYTYDGKLKLQMFSLDDY
ncbi:hypothetical protein GCK72_022526 [Caenorhabditis remanei]|uniref:Protein kinase domain-containing protein n=1 Tax=Caenorhabditis remanei TaxID=31234 RepID=A0A6A5FU59_CAERE|nr:hypothetical protein GCK72_022526 [Caenorhabditis remanei]KAF1746074.1 hypothetical protein GCK72_022526 [Caenorhabditis remanei]